MKRMLVERAVLGTMLHSHESVRFVLYRLTIKDFFFYENRTIFEAIQSLASRLEPINLVSVDEELTRLGRLDGVGGQRYLVSLHHGAPSRRSLPDFVRELNRKAKMQKIMACVNENDDYKQR